VYDVNGDKVGSVQQFMPQANCLLVEKGMLFKKDVYIPVSAIASTGVDGVRINLSKDDLKDTRYASPPTATSAAPMRNTDDDILRRQAQGVDEQGLPLEQDTDMNP
jgi:uncharacterized protein YrrD